MLYDDFALGRSIIPPHAACVRPALIRWDPRVPFGLENLVVAEMKDVWRAMRIVFAVPEGDVLHQVVFPVGHLRRCTRRSASS